MKIILRIFNVIPYKEIEIEWEGRFLPREGDVIHVDSMSLKVINPFNFMRKGTIIYIDVLAVALCSALFLTK